MGEFSLSGEQWLDVPGYEGFYSASSWGRVRSEDRSTLDARGVVKHYRGKLLALRLNPGGRLWVRLCKDGEQRVFSVHRLVLMAFVGPCPEGMEGCHNDGNEINNTPSNLRWDTKASNMVDRIRHGRNDRVNRICCPLGHLLSVPNLVVCRLARGHRICLACQRARQMKFKILARGGTFDLRTEAGRRYVQIMAGEANGNGSGSDTRNVG